MKDMSEKYSDSLLGAKLAATVANSLTKPFFSVQPTPADPESRERVLTKTHDADPEAVLQMTAAAVDVIRKRSEKALNLSYRQIVGQRVHCLVSLQRTEEARSEINQLHEDFQKTGVNPPVLRQIRAFADEVDTAGTTRVQKLWERVRAQDRKVEKTQKQKSDQ